MREERDAVKLDTFDPWIGVEDHVEEEMAAFVGHQPNRSAGEELPTAAVPIHTLCGFLLFSLSPRR